ncbi:MAG: cell wall-binding repeat-containing protein, partial [Coriobacteriia bacterium]|nr:cell wall-binding repeat-containing protein [Coriobacteriia bacterium]
STMCWHSTLDLYTDDGTHSPNTSTIDFNHSAAVSKSVTISPGEWGAGDYAPVYVDVLRAAGSGSYTFFWYTEPDPAYFERVSGADRFEVAQQLEIYTRWPDDSHVSDVVIASGDDAAAADPLAAGGLCWAYNAPLLLVSKTASKNAGTMINLADIEGFSGRVRVHVVGGTSTIPPTVYNQIVAAVGSAADVERIPGANRYDVARNIALRMRDVRNDHEPGVLFANGADSTKFFDALALSAVSAHTGMPVLLVKKDSIPVETTDALASMTSTTPRFVAGGTATVSDAVRSALGATRWWGSDRYSTAKDVADEAITRGYLSSHSVAIASKLPDALSAGADVGFLGGPVLVVKPDSLPSATKAFLESKAEVTRRLWPVGGPVSIKQSVIDAAASALD